jgi:hypothetical protein
MDNMIRLIDDNINLYRPDKKSYLASLEYAKQMSVRDAGPMVFHCFWRVPGAFGEKQAGVLKSIVASHHSRVFEINLWSNVDLSDSSYIGDDVRPYVRLRKWDYAEERKGTILENSGLNSFDDELCYLEGDLFRLLILHKYGGFYIDMDVLVLRDMSPLNHMEFLYQWGTSGTSTRAADTNTSGTSSEPTMKMNGAIMRLDARSDLSLEFLELILSTPPCKNSFCWGSELYSKTKKNTVLCLPGVWFDSEWGFEGAVNNPFGKVENVEVFEGAYAWHWHNKWDAIIEEGSKFRVIIDGK